MRSMIRLPEEILSLILSSLAIPDLLQCSRVCRLLRTIATDPVLHSERLHRASYNLQRELRSRRSRTAISPPNAWIWLSRTYVLSRSIGKSLIKIRLSHNLERRPSSRDLVARAILPSCAVSVSPVLIQCHRAIHKSKLRNALCRKLERRPSIDVLISFNIIPEECVRRTVSPTIFERRKRVIKESLKDGLRAWVQNRGLAAQRCRMSELEETERIAVKALVRRIMAQRLAQELDDRIDAAGIKQRRVQARWGRALDIQRNKDEMRITNQGPGCAHPTRAHVLSLRRFWEGITGTPIMGVPFDIAQL